jgi:dipeptidyl aminopeptidase/acylaminoacyl peptidase
MKQRFLCQVWKYEVVVFLLVLLAACNTSSATSINANSKSNSTPVALNQNEAATPLAATTNTPSDHIVLYAHDCGLYAVPPVAALDDPAMHSIYSAVTDCAFDLPRYFIGYAPLLSPDARRLLITTPYETWVADFAAGKSQRLLSEQIAATWDPAGEQITYVSGDKLYTWSLATAAPPQALFQHPDLLDTFARWSPDGKWIAAVTITNTPASDATSASMWVIPTYGGAARELGSFPLPPMEIAPQDVRWSPDSQTIGTWTGWLFPLNGLPRQIDLNTISWWEPAQARRLIGNQVDPKWAFSRDGQRLVYTTPASDGAEVWSIATSAGTATLVGTVPSTATPLVLRWSPDERAVLIGLNDATIWSLPIGEGVSSTRVFSDGTLIDVVPVSH